MFVNLYVSLCRVNSDKTYLFSIPDRVRTNRVLLYIYSIEMSVAVLISHSGDTQGSSCTQLLLLEPLTGNTLDKREATGVDGCCLALVGSADSIERDSYFIAASKTSRISLFPGPRGSGSVHSTQAPVRSLVSSPDGRYYAGGVRERVHVWEGATGSQVSVLSQHYQSVSALAFSPDGTYLFSGGEDGIILVWRFPLVVSTGYMSQLRLLSVPQSVQHKCNEARLKLTLAEHALPITALVAGLGGARGLLYSAAADLTCRIWDLLRGVCLATVAVGGLGTCLATDLTERVLLVGQKHGEILKIEICFSLPQTVTSLITGENNREGASTAVQHETEVTSVVALRDNLHFVSSDASGQVITWDLASLQALRRLELRDSVTAILLLPLSSTYATQSARGRAAPLNRPPVPAWMPRTPGEGEEGLTLSIRLREAPVELGQETGEQGEVGETNLTEDFINSRIANNEHFQKLTASLDNMYRQAVELDFNY